MRIVFVGTGDFGQPALRALLGAGHEIVAAISQPDRPAGRGRKLRPSAIHAAAESAGIRHVQTEAIDTLDPAEVAPAAELALVAAFGQRIGPRWLTALPHGMINIHASLLPAYRGAAPFQWAIINGETETGVTIFRLDEDWDAGPIYGMRSTPIGELETATELHDRLAVLGAELAVDVIGRIADGRIEPIPQDPTKASRAPKLSRADGVVDFSQDAFAVQRRIHGCWSWPAVTCELQREGQRPERVQLARAERIDDDSTPGAVRPGAFLDDATIQTGRGRLRLLEVKPAGGRLMAFDDYARGRRIAPPARLVSGGLRS